MIEFEIQLKKKQLEQLNEGEEINFKLLPPKCSRKENMQGDAVGNKINKLIQKWNDSKYIQNKPNGESKNNVFTISELPEYKTLFKRAIKEIGLPKLSKAIDTYFEACSQGKHVWNGHNHGYKHLGGFIRTVLEAQKKNKKLWWVGKKYWKIEDNHPNLTLYIANAYAKKFLGRKEYGLENPSTVYPKFKKAGDCVREKYQKLPVKRDEVVLMLLDCVEQTCEKTNTQISAGWLCSDNMWKDYFPQYLKKVFG